MVERLGRVHVKEFRGVEPPSAGGLGRRVRVEAMSPWWVVGVDELGLRKRDNLGQLLQDGDRVCRHDIRFATAPLQGSLVLPGHGRDPGV